MNHLAIYNKSLYYYDVISHLLSGKRTMDMKFHTTKSAPYDKLRNGDCIYLKESSGPIYGRVFVSDVAFVEIYDPEQIRSFLKSHSIELDMLNESHIERIVQRCCGRRYLSYWHISRAERSLYPVIVYKRDRRTWVVGYEPDDEVSSSFL
jgi:hypothetical protein